MPNSPPASHAIRRVPEYALQADERAGLLTLLTTCFPDFLSDRIYYKQLPHGRFVGTEEGRIVAQASWDYRVVAVDETPVRIVGVGDVAVLPEFRRRGWAGALLDAVERFARQETDAAFLVLFADDHRLYLRQGYTLIGPGATWLGIHEHRSVGLVEHEVLDACLMVKALGEEMWPVGTVDFLGTTF